MVLWPFLEPLTRFHESRVRSNPGGLLCRARQFLNELLVLDNRDSGLTIESALGAGVCLFSGRKRRLADDESLVSLVSLDTKSHALIFVSRTTVLRLNIRLIEVDNVGPRSWIIS